MSMQNEEGPVVPDPPGFLANPELDITREDAKKSVGTSFMLTPILINIRSIIMSFMMRGNLMMVFNSYIAIITAGFTAIFNAVTTDISVLPMHRATLAFIGIGLIAFVVIQMFKMVMNMQTVPVVHEEERIDYHFLVNN